MSPIVGIVEESLWCFGLERWKAVIGGVGCEGMNAKAEVLDPLTYLGWRGCSECVAGGVMHCTGNRDLLGVGEQKTHQVIRVPATSEQTQTKLPSYLSIYLLAYLPSTYRLLICTFKILHPQTVIIKGSQFYAAQVAPGMRRAGAAGY